MAGEASGLDGHLDDALPPGLEELVGRVDVLERVGVGDEGSGVQLPGGDQVQGLGTVAAIHPAGLEGEILAVHVGQRE